MAAQATRGKRKMRHQRGGLGLVLKTSMLCIAIGGCSSEPSRDDVAADAAPVPDGTTGTEVCGGVPATCGLNQSEDCCMSLQIFGGTYNRSNDPIYPATVAEFRLDKYEVTVGRFRKFVAAVVAGWRPAPGAGKHGHLNGGNGLVSTTGAFETGWDPSWDVHLYADQAAWDADTALNCDEPTSTWTPTEGANETRPINCVNWYQSAAFCIWDGGFLPSEAEWNYAAAGGAEQREYPWGATAPDTDAALAVYGCYYSGTGQCSGVQNVAPVGSAPAGAAKWGHLDMAGNVFEWVLDTYVASYFNPCTDCSYLEPAESHVLRGGAFFSEVKFMATKIRGGNKSEEHWPNFGLRCARAPSSAD